jgi:hypothetical protein
MLDSCLEDILEDGASLEAALARFPRHADRLRPLLEHELTALQWLDGRRDDIYLPPEYLADSKTRLLAQLDQRPQGWPQKIGAWFSSRWSNATILVSRAELALSIALVVILVITAWYSLDHSVRAARTSLPGGSFYPLKIAGEKARLAFTFDEAQKARLHSEFARTRLLELQALVFEGQYEPIPEVVADYQVHAHGAVEALIRLSGGDRQAAANLAHAYHDATSAEINLMILLSGTTQGNTNSHIENVLSTSQHGEAELQNLLSPGNGGTIINYW